MAALAIISIIVVLCIVLSFALFGIFVMIDKKRTNANTVSPPSDASSGTVSPPSGASSDAMSTVNIIRKIIPTISTASKMTETQILTIINRNNALLLPSSDSAMNAYKTLMIAAKTAGTDTTQLERESMLARDIIKVADGIRRPILNGYPCGTSYDEMMRFFKDCKATQIKKMTSATCPSATVKRMTDNLTDPPPIIAGINYCVPSLGLPRSQYIFSGPQYTDTTTKQPSTYWMAYR